MQPEGTFVGAPRRNQVRPFTQGDLALDPVDNKVTLAHSGRIVGLTPIDARLLRSLIASPGRILTRATLMAKVWGHEYEGESNQLDVYMKRLRSKIEEDPSQPQLLLTMRGVGYKYQPADGPVLASSDGVGRTAGNNCCLPCRG